jgi:trehalose-6-phosphate synthase
MNLSDFLSADGFFGEAYRTMNNPNENDFMDEQLQMALRISLEEEKKRIEEMEKKKLEERQPEVVGNSPIF